LVRVSSPDVLVETVKMSTDGKAYIVRLWGMSDKNVRASLKWSRPLKGLWLSDLTEEPLRAVRGSIEVPAGGALTVRAVFE